MKKMVLIDGHHFMFRAFYAFYQMLDEKDPKNAVFGFASMLFTILQKQKPDYLAFAFDKGRSFRHDEKEDYKGTRSECPEALKIQMPKIYEMVRIMGIPQYYTEGFEADDVLGSVATQVSHHYEDIEIMIVSGDRDFLQLVNDKISIAAPQKGGMLRIFQSADVEEFLGVTPAQVPDFKGIAGDSADNIKGVLGIGPKTAVELLKQFGSLENIYDRLDEVKLGTRKKLEEHKDNAIHSKYLATIVTNAPVDWHIDHIRFNGLHSDVVSFFKEMKFPSLEARAQFFVDKNSFTGVLGDAHDVFGGGNSEGETVEKKAPKMEQLSLF